MKTRKQSVDEINAILDQQVADSVMWQWMRERMTYGRAGNTFGWVMTEIIPDPDSNGVERAVMDAMNAEDETEAE